MLFIFVIFFSDIEQCFRPAQTKIQKSKGRLRLDKLEREQYTVLLVNISGLYKSYCRLKLRYRPQTTDRIPKFVTDRQ